jgi:beta-xylosidase
MHGCKVPLISAKLKRIKKPSMTTLNHPVLPGFNPDPSLLRVGDSFHIATSTFEWFGGTSA